MKLASCWLRPLCEIAWWRWQTSILPSCPQSQLTVNPSHQQRQGETVEKDPDSDTGVMPYAGRRIVHVSSYMRAEASGGGRI